MANPHPVGGWKPGQSGNPKGGLRKDESLTGLLRKYMDEEISPDGKKRKEAFIQAVAKHAVNGDAVLIKYLWDRLDGQMKQEILMHSTTISIKGPPEPQGDADDNADAVDPDRPPESLPSMET